MKKFVIIIGILIAVGTYFFWFRGGKEASFRRDASRLRETACMENPTIETVLILTPDLLQDTANGIEMVFAEANNRQNPDGSVGVKVLDSNGVLRAKRIQLRTYTYGSREESLNLARSISRQYNVSAVIGHYTSDITYPSSLIYNDAGVLYICPFATSTRITSHNWPTIIRVIPPVRDYMSAILENLTQIFGENYGTIRIAVFYTESIYSDDAVTSLHNYIASNNRLVDLLDNGEAMMEAGTLSPDSLMYQWLDLNRDVKSAMQDEIDMSDRLFMTQMLAHYGFTVPGIKQEDIDIFRIHDHIDELLVDGLTVGTAISRLRELSPHVELVHLERYRMGTTEFSQAIRMLPKTKADVIMILDYLNETSLELMKELRESGNKQPIIGDDGLEYPSLIEEYLHNLAGDIYLVNVYDDDQHGAFLSKKFEELSEYLPSRTKATFHANYPTYQGYKAASLFVHAAAESQSSVPLSIASRLKHTTGEGWNSMSGNAIYFDSRGDISNPEFILKKYHDGTFKRFKQEAGL